ncbi:hypothetical protein QJS10_CPB21g01046 [Acorus calamus]|uniref:Uncharacterized protein n=1 Tax=Acorus calamus TaxID=4465 RepID=A0AAV9C5Y8_ACOCL|nr:hypothetical protein QJS10_CPB21g01046 [Acorus calamus]
MCNPEPGEDAVGDGANVTTNGAADLQEVQQQVKWMYVREDTITDVRIYFSVYLVISWFI